MGNPTFRLGQTKGLVPDYDPYGVFSGGGLSAPGLFRNGQFGDLRLRLNAFEGDPKNETFHYHRMVRAEKLRNEIVRVATEEWEYWQKDHGRGKKPTVDDGHEGSARVRKYWQNVNNKNRTTAQLRKDAWSAAFISYVMKEAGALPDFKKAQKHTYFFYHAKQARRERYGSLFKAYPASGPGAVTPDVGDVIANTRGGNNFTYDTLKDYGISHSDIVVSKKNGLLVVIGGNVSPARGSKKRVVGKKYILLSPSGHLQSVRYYLPDGQESKDAVNYYSVMKIESRTSNLLRPGAKR